MINLIVFLIGLCFLGWFSYQDLKTREVSNQSIITFQFISIFFIVSSPGFILLSLVAFTFIWCYFLWTKKSLGGADVKVLPFLIPFVLIGSPNYFVYYFFFLFFLAFNGLAYGLISNNQIKKFKNKRKSKKIEMPFFPVILLVYILFKIFVLLSI